MCYVRCIMVYGPSYVPCSINKNHRSVLNRLLEALLVLLSQLEDLAKEPAISGAFRQLVGDDFAKRYPDLKANIVAISFLIF